jgi:hypothetical protein
MSLRGESNSRQSKTAEFYVKAMKFQQQRREKNTRRTTVRAARMFKQFGSVALRFGRARLENIGVCV